MTSPCRLFLHTFTVLCLFYGSHSKGPPRVTSHTDLHQVTKPGEEVKLLCPIDGDPKPMLEWQKDGERITALWRRYRLTSTYLRIRNITVQDSGQFVCKGVNGFGQEVLKFQLEVIGDQNDSASSTLPGSHITKPSFSSVTLAQSTTIIRPAGASEKIRCLVTGNPPPTIHWLKDGVHIADFLSPDMRLSHNQRSLIFQELSPSDNGIYTCLAANMAGEVTLNFTVEVVDRIRSKPQLTGMDPVNTTVWEGGTTAFQCHVKSDVDVPHIQWLKYIGPDEAVPSDHTIDVNGQKYRVLQTSDVLRQTENLYLNKLAIIDARPADSGVYVCLGANTMGYSYKKAFLTVKPHVRRDTDSMSDSDFPMWVLVTLPMLVVVLAAVFSVCLLKRKKKQQPSSPPSDSAEVERALMSANAAPVRGDKVYVARPAAPLPHIYRGNPHYSTYSSQRTVHEPSSVHKYAGIYNGHKHCSHQHLHYNP